MSNNRFKKLKTVKNIEVGGFRVRFFFKEGNIEQSYMEIKTVSNNWYMKIDARSEVYGYLYTAASQGLENQIHGYCATLYAIATGIISEQQFTDEVQKAIIGFMERMDKKAKEESDKITETQEMADEALMREAIERGKLRGNKKAEAKARKESEKAIKEVLEDGREE